MTRRHASPTWLWVVFGMIGVFMLCMRREPLETVYGSVAVFAASVVLAERLWMTRR